MSELKSYTSFVQTPNLSHAEPPSVPGTVWLPLGSWAIMNIRHANDITWKIGNSTVFQAPCFIYIYITAKIRQPQQTSISVASHLKPHVPTRSFDTTEPKMAIENCSIPGYPSDTVWHGTRGYYSAYDTAWHGLSRQPIFGYFTRLTSFSVI